MPSKSPPSPPSRTVRADRSARPVMVLLDLLGRRWTMRVLWELRDGPRTFRALQEACDALSPTVLNTRLAELREAALVERSSEGGYVLSALGAELLERFSPIVGWAEKWAAASSAAPAAKTRQPKARA